MTLTEHIERQMSEESLQNNIIELAGLTGWDAPYHTRDSRRSVEGFPDLVMTHSRENWLIVAELKSKRGVVSYAQRRWLDQLSRNWQIAVYIWYPANWISGAIERILRYGPDGQFSDEGRVLPPKLRIP